MKKFFTMLLLSVAIISKAQDTTKVEQYCELVASSKILSRKVTIDINYGEKRTLWRDYRIKDDNGRFQSFNSVVDALNFLGSNGWKMLNAYPISDGGMQVYHFYFKKEFDKSQTEEN